MHFLGARYSIVFLLATAGFLAGFAALAQSPCETALQEAEKSYLLGLFEDVPGQLEPCLKGQSSRAEIVRAQALLAQSYIELDQPEKAQEAVAELLRIDSTYEPGPQPRFAALIEEIRRREADLQVSTVSKTSESLREAPATVIVIRAEEIERRGYLDLEQVLHDLPGFDITRGNGETYSTFYQRGFRSKDNDRILLLVDGVEQNSLSSGVAHLSRQYPVSSVDRIEVVYGPASTMYGANAYSGVINIITKAPEEWIPQGRSFGVMVQEATGSFATRYTDLALAGKDRSGSLAWSVNGRFYRSDEHDLSRFSTWRRNFRDVPYKEILRLTGDEAFIYCLFFDPCSRSPLVQVTLDDQGSPVVDLTDEGERLARQLDEEADLSLSEGTEDWSLSAKLRIANLLVGLQAWGLEEGTASWYNGDASAQHGSGTWAPEHKSLFIKYGRSLGKSLNLNLFARFREDSLDPQTSNRTQVFTYANGSLHMRNLVGDCNLVQPCRPSALKAELFEQLSSQAASELTLVYSPRRQFTFVSGVDLKKGSTQNRQIIKFALPIPQDVELINQVVDHTDVGAYAQVSYKPFPVLSLVVGGRLDYGEASSLQFPKSGFGTIFSPRLTLAYLPGRSIFKLIYSEAFKDPTDFEKFSTDRNTKRFANPQLRPERTRSIELSAGWRRDGRTSLELSAYQVLYKDVVGFRQICLDTSVAQPRYIPCEPGLPFVYSQFQNFVDLEVRGVELRADTHVGKVSLFGNLTYTDPVSIKPSRVRIGDIASTRANLGIDFPLWKKAHLNLRWNYVGARRTGQGTTVPTNPLRSIDPYSVASATFTYKDLLPGASVQLIVNNLLDEAYEHPGVLTADGTDLAASIPQPGRTVYARITWGLWPRKMSSRELP